MYFLAENNERHWKTDAKHIFIYKRAWHKIKRQGAAPYQNPRVKTS